MRARTKTRELARGNRRYDELNQALGEVVRCLAEAAAENEAGRAACTRKGVI